MMYEHKLQKGIIEELKVNPSIDPEEEIKKTIDFMKDYMITQINNGLKIKSYVLGLSGGQDSTLLGKLTQMAINELNEELEEQRFQFVAVRLPYGEQKDEQDAQDAIQFIKPNKVVTINIKKAVDASVEEIERATGEKLSNFLKGNEKARERMKAQYSLAGLYQGLVLGTDHAAEAVTGFYTKWGDGAADLAPLFRLTKSQGKEMLKRLNAPEHLYTKTPTADLEDDKPQLPDEVALGVTYEEIDNYLTGNKINPKSAEIIERHYTKTRHKRESVITIFDDWWKSNN